MDKNQDGKATFDEVKEYLAKYSPVIKDSEVEKFIARRDVNGNTNVVITTAFHLARNTTLTFVYLLLLYLKKTDLFSCVSSKKIT